MDNKLHSKTFVFGKVMLAVQFVEEIDKFNYTRVWHDTKIRITVEKNRIDHVDTIASKYEGQAIVGNKGEWKAAWK